MTVDAPPVDESPRFGSADSQRRAFALWAARLYPFQRTWIGETRDFALCVKARQIGFSHSIAAGATVQGRYYKRPQIVLSASLALASEVLSKVKAHCSLLAHLGDPGACDFSVNNSTTVAWHSGGRVIVLPASQRTARSFTGDVWLDEFAYHQDPEGIRDAAFPMATRGNWRVRIISTPNGAQGLFHEWATNLPAGWGYYSVTVDDAIAQGLDVDRAKLWALCGGDERLFAQWYRCSFLDANLQYIPTAMADAALRWVGDLPDLDGAEVYAGLDVAREADLTALTVLASKAGRVWVLAIITCRRTAFREQKAMVARARELFGWERLFVDRTGIGAQLAEELVEKWGESEVVPVTFTSESKADMATRTLRWFRDGRVRFVRDSEGAELHKETIALRRKVTAAQQVVYEHERTAKGHGDRYWSFALALIGCGDPPQARGMGEKPLFPVA